MEGKVLTQKEIQEIVERAENATPGPWEWGDGWADLHTPICIDENPDTDKYADLALSASGLKEIIPIRIDHYEPIYDCDESASEPCKHDRDFIAHARQDIPNLLATLSDHDSRVKALVSAARLFAELDDEGTDDLPDHTGIVVQIGKRAINYSLSLKDVRTLIAALEPFKEGS